MRRHVDLFLPDSLDELVTALSGETPGQEWWKLLVLCVLLTLIAEIALTRWIAVHRHLHRAEPIVLHSPVEGVRAMKARLTELMEKPKHGP
jgi:hypothetical protein